MEDDRAAHRHVENSWRAGYDRLGGERRRGHAPSICEVAPALFGYAIDSDRPIHSARPGPADRGRLRIATTSAELLDEVGDLISWWDGYGVQFALARVPDGILASCSLTGTHRTSTRAGVVETRPRGDQESWEHRICATMIPLLLADRGDLSLHAATVLLGERAAVFCGPSGRGKSTIAASLALRGSIVSSEDASVITDIDLAPRAWAGEAGVRVSAEGLSVLGGSIGPDEPDHKALRLVATQPLRAPPPAELAAVVVLLEPAGQRLSLTRLDPAAAVPAVMPSVMYGGPTRLASALGLVGRLVERVPVFTARFPNDLAAVGDVASEILGVIDGGVRVDAVHRPVARPLRHRGG